MSSSTDTPVVTEVELYQCIIRDVPNTLLLVPPLLTCSCLTINNIMMTSFKWSKKSCPVNSSLSEFSNRDEDDSDTLVSTEALNGDRLQQTESGKIETMDQKIERLKREATFAVDHDKYWTAINKWNELLLITPEDPKIHEMKAQVLNILHEIFPAKESAEAAVKYSNKSWHTAYQTLGRCYLNVGQIDSAIRAFSSSIHLRPDDREVWEQDLKWALELKKKEKGRDDDAFFDEVQRYRNGMAKRRLVDSDDEHQDPCEKYYHHCVEDLTDGNNDSDDEPLISPDSCKPS